MLFGSIRLYSCSTSCDHREKLVRSSYTTHTLMRSDPDLQPTQQKEALYRRDCWLVTRCTAHDQVTKDEVEERRTATGGPVRAISEVSALRRGANEGRRGWCLTWLWLRMKGEKDLRESRRWGKRVGGKKEKRAKWWKKNSDNMRLRTHAEVKM